MKLRHLLPPAIIASLFALTAFASDPKAKTTADASCPTGACCFLANTTATPAAPAPGTCVVSGDKLGDMGKPVQHPFKQAGKPDRIVPLCCKDCIADFEKEPAKYLTKLDAQEAAANAAPKK